MVLPTFEGAVSIGTAGIEFKDFILGFRQSTFLCTTLKCIEKVRIPFIKSGIPASNLGSSEAQNPAKFAACTGTKDEGKTYCYHVCQKSNDSHAKALLQ